MKKVSFSFMWPFIFSLNSMAAHSGVKKITIEGQAYTCRPAHAQVMCPLETNLGFVIALATDAAESLLCVERLKENGETITGECPWGWAPPSRT